MVDDDRVERRKLLAKDSTQYIRSMDHFELVKVLEGCGRSGGLSQESVDELLDERYPLVRPEWIPEEMW